MDITLTGSIHCPNLLQNPSEIIMSSSLNYLFFYKLLNLWQIIFKIKGLREVTYTSPY